MTVLADQCINSTFSGELEGKLAPFLPSLETQGQIL